jgi:hypothetical protein
MILAKIDWLSCLVEIQERNLLDPRSQIMDSLYFLNRHSTRDRVEELSPGVISNHWLICSATRIPDKHKNSKCNSLNRTESGSPIELIYFKSQPSLEITSESFRRTWIKVSMSTNDRWSVEYFMKSRATPSIRRSIKSFSILTYYNRLTHSHVMHSTRTFLFRHNSRIFRFSSVTFHDNRTPWLILVIFTFFIWFFCVSSILSHDIDQIRCGRAC